MNVLRRSWLFNALPMPARFGRALGVEPSNRDKGKSGRATADQPLREVGSEWFKVVQNSADELTLYLYGAVGGDWFDEGITADSLRNELQEFTGHTLNVHINSPGGSVFEGIAVQNLLANHPANVHISVDGLAASIASVIAMSGDTITMCPGSMMMIHEASGLAWGNAADMRQLAGVLDKISGNIADAYARRCGGEVDEWRTAMHAETWYTADEAVTAGLADKVAAAKASPADGAPPAIDEPAEDVAAKAPEHLYRFRDRAHAPAPVLVPRRARNAVVEPVPAPTDQLPAEPPLFDFTALRDALIPRPTTPPAPAAGTIDHEGILSMLKNGRGQA